MSENSKTDAQHFDVPALRAALQAKMGEHVADYPEHTEQRFPHILAKIAEGWGTSKLDAYLDMLLLPERQERQGFPNDVAIEIFRLSSIHGQLTFDHKATASGWGAVVDADLDKKGFNSQ